MPEAVEDAVSCFADPGLSRVCWPMVVVDAHGRRTGALTNTELPEGDLTDAVFNGGRYTDRWSPTSGNAWRRTFLDAVFPVPERAFTNYVDNYLSALAPLYGRVAARGPLGFYRAHATNETTSYPTTVPFAQRLEDWVERFEVCLRATEVHARRNDLPFEADAWRAASWWLDHDTGLSAWLERHAALVVATDDVTIFRLESRP